MPEVPSSMKMATCRASRAFSEAKVRLTDAPIIGSGSDSTCRCTQKAPADVNLHCLSRLGTEPRTGDGEGRGSLPDFLLFVLHLFVFSLGALGLNACDSSLKPVLYVLPKPFFRLRRSDRISLLVQRDVVAGNVLRAVLLGHKMVKQALMAGMRARRIPM